MSIFKEILNPLVPVSGLALMAFDSHSGVLVRTPSSTLIFDPLGIRAEEVARADAIIITHEHSDHLNIPLVRELRQKTDAVVVTTPFVARLFRGVPSERLRPLKIWESILVKGNSLCAWPSVHPGRRPLSFFLETEDGVRLYHPSDSDPFPEMGRLARKGGPDLLLYLGSSLEKALQIVDLVRPQTLLSRYLEPMQTAQRLETETNGTRSAILHPLEIFRYP
ncbi:MAG: MBL fold metallo-hydrolase [Candidatus Binatia bacterium]|jgi:glyoxylase-like metal-dependent hydrolase (beta-lactamase superfamily II)|nr:MBL fold metallo-hydrolase [Candidatus Binatia bacterium]